MNLLLVLVLNEVAPDGLLSLAVINEGITVYGYPIVAKADRSSAQKSVILHYPIHLVRIHRRSMHLDDQPLDSFYPCFTISQ